MKKIYERVTTPQTFRGVAEAMGIDLRNFENSRYFLFDDWELVEVAESLPRVLRWAEEGAEPLDSLQDLPTPMTFLSNKLAMEELMINPEGKQWGDVLPVHQKVLRYLVDKEEAVAGYRAIDGSIEWFSIGHAPQYLHNLQYYFKPIITMTVEEAEQALGSEWAVVIVR
jgi:hypothetical protein